MVPIFVDPINACRALRKANPLRIVKDRHLSSNIVKTRHFATIFDESRTNARRGADDPRPGARRPALLRGAKKTSGGGTRHRAPHLSGI